MEKEGRGNLREIYLAGGCFWGVEEYFSYIPGVVDAVSGYANGSAEDPSYEDVCRGDTGHAETVRVTYDPRIISLSSLVEQLFAIIDPLSVNRQGNDVGEQYRTGVYYTDETDLAQIQEAFASQEQRLGSQLAVELEPLRCFYPAEEYHQDYLKKNPGGYCHVSFNSLSDVKTELQKAAKTPDWSCYSRPSDEELRAKLTDQQYAITQHAGTERAFTGEYDNHFERGIYVDIATGQPLFSSDDKYDSGCGWPAFTRPIDEAAVLKRDDRSFGMHRIEVRSSVGESHLGHVFHDGPADRGGLRYCINSAALRFVPYDRLAEEGYGDLRNKDNGNA